MTPLKYSVFRKIHMQNMLSLVHNLSDNELEKNSLLNYEYILYLKIQDFCDITLCSLV